MTHVFAFYPSKIHGLFAGFRVNAVHWISTTTVGARKATGPGGVPVGNNGGHMISEPHTSRDGDNAVSEADD